MLLSSEHLSLRGERPKFFPKFVGPFVIKELRGVNTVELSIGKGTRFGLKDAVVNVERLRPYKRRPAHLGPTEEAQQPEALVEDPRGCQGALAAPPCPCPMSMCAVYYTT